MMTTANRIRLMLKTNINFYAVQVWVENGYLKATTKGERDGILQQIERVIPLTLKHNK